MAVVFPPEYVKGKWIIKIGDSVTLKYKSQTKAEEVYSDLLESKQKTKFILRAVK